MWWKIVKGIYVGAKATGVDKWLVNWVKNRIKKQDQKMEAVMDKAADIDDFVAENPELR